MIDGFNKGDFDLKSLIATHAIYYSSETNNEQNLLFATIIQQKDVG